MPKSIFFNSSMPRSGSTLLQNILGNNPSIYSTPTSGLLELLHNNKKTFSQSAAFKAQDEALMKKAFLTACYYSLNGFFEPLTDKPYVIDKNRGWAVQRPFLDAFYPEPKIICMVRDLRDIVASMEKNFRKYPEKWDLSLQNDMFTLGDRVTLFMHPKGKPVGFTLKNLREVFDRGYQDKILFVRFEDLTSDPQRELDKVHDYLEIPKFRYDFDNIEQVTHEDDKFHGKYGDHKIEKAVKPVPSKAKEILGDLICEQIYDNHEWYFTEFGYKK
jgi:sulfotransferase